MAVVLAVIALLGIATACGPGASSHTEARTGEISENSQIVYGRHAQASDHDPAKFNTVGLTDAPDAMPFCTGALIASNRILTAAHCLTKGNARFARFAGPSIEEPVYVRITQQMIFPLYTQNGGISAQALYPSFDIGWVKLESDAPSPFRAVPIYSSATPPEQGDEVVAAGYGNSEESRSEIDGVLRTAVLSFYARHLDPHFFRVMELMQAGQGVDTGDSGGPAYIQQDGEWKILGTVVGARLDRTLSALGSAYYSYAPEYIRWLASSWETGENTDPDDVAALIWGRERLHPTHLTGMCQQFGVTRGVWKLVNSALKGVSALNCGEATLRSGQTSSYRNGIIFQIDDRFLDEGGAFDPRAISKILMTLSGAPSITLTNQSSIRPFRLDLTPLRGLTQLREVILSGIRVSDVSLFAGLPSLNKLWLYNAGLRNLSGFERFQSKQTLQELDLSGNAIPPFELRRLQGFTSLKKLRIEGNHPILLRASCPREVQDCEI